MRIYSELAKHLSRPVLYERTRENFWNDLYISGQMLVAHLDQNTDATSRKPDFIVRCADWVTTLIPKNAELLDIGCGPGLYTKQFAERGLRVTGLDFSAGSIAYAREYDPGSNYVLQNYLSMDFESVFDIITLIYCDYGALIPDERSGLLQRIYKALKPGGLFLFDVFTPLKGKNKHESTSWDISPIGGFWSSSPYICFTGNYYYGERAEGCRHVIVEENVVRCINLWDCYFTRQSLLEETASYGFSEYGFYNDATGNPYTDESETLCAILIKLEE